MTAAPWRLFGVECHDCGRPAEWFDNGVTWPCGCGLAPGQNPDSVLGRIENATTTTGSPRTAIVASAILADREANRVIDSVETEAWREILICLDGLRKFARSA